MDNDGWHLCHFCGADVKDGKEANGKSHLLIDCRPDLVEHEIGETCTWSYRDDNTEVGPMKPNCYAYQNPVTLEWGNEHKFFYPKEAQT